jgi:type I restriction enzyme S subunit
MSSSVPDGWSAASLGELCKFSGGSAFKEKYQGKSSGQFPFIKVSDMNLTGNERFITNANHWIDESIRTEAKVKLFPPLSVVFAKVGAALLLNRRRILIRDTAIDNNMMAAIPNSNDNNFLYYVLQEIDLGEIVQGGAVPSINQAQMEDIPALIPPLPEQQKIATILSSVDKVIETTRAQIDKLKDLKTGMMQELLTKGIGVDGTPHTEFKDSPVGRIPVVWEVLRLKQITLKIRDGNYGADYPSAAEMLDAGIPFLTSAVIGNDQNIIYKKIKYISENKHKQLAKAHIKINDILFTNRGANVGNVAIVPSDLDDANIGPQLTFLRVNEEIASPLFLLIAMQSEYFRTQLTQQDSGSAMNFFGIGTTENFLFGIPSKEEQEKIAFAIDSVNSRIIKLDSKLGILNNTKKALMQDLLTGKVRVAIDENKKEPEAA